MLLQRRFRPLIAAAVVAVATTLASGFGAANAQDSVPAAAAENGRLWFVELEGAPVADGRQLNIARAEKETFRRNAKAAGIRYTERRSFDVLWNGLSIEVHPADRAKLREIPGVKAIYPVQIIAAPDPQQASGSAPDLAAAIAATGAKAAQQSGLTGAGIKVGVIDTGIDIDHPAFGGGGVPGGTAFPTPRIVAGYDFVGDNYDSSGSPAQQVPVPDANPDDCNGHGTHVAGIVGANGPSLTGVAPGVKLGAYRVFGCNGTTSADIMLAAMEMALADGMHVVNQSIGSRAQWPQYPTAQASTRLVNKGVVMVASIGNNGPGGSAPDALFAAGAPGVGSKVIGVASFDNAQRAFFVNGTPYGYNHATGSPLPPTAGSLPMSRTGTTTTPDDACPPWEASFGGAPWQGGAWLAPGSFTGQAVLVRRGTCSFHAKALNAQQAGAAAIVLYNNVAGALNPTVAGATPITIPVVAVTQAQGATLNALIASGPTTLHWSDDYVSYPFGTGGLISGFSSFGLAADLSLKPDLGAPGGGIFSAYPLEQGGAATLSGTSMSSPHVAGGVALILEARPKVPSNAMLARLQNPADPKNWSGNPDLGFLDHTFRQGAGMLDIMGTIQSKVVVEPSKIAVGESQGGAKMFQVTVKNEGASNVAYNLSHAPALATGHNTMVGASYALTGVFNAPATVSFSVPSVNVPAGGSASFNVTIDAHPGLPDRSLYGGYVVLTPQVGTETFRVPFAGFKGDYQSTQVLTAGPIPAAPMPWLAKLSGGSFFLQPPTGATYTMVGDDIPFFLLHLDHHSRRILLEAFDANTGKAWHRVSDDEYVGRNATPGGFFAFTWDGNTFTGKGKNANQWRTVPDGSYVVKLSVLKALGDENNPAHWETWTSPTITIDRP